MEQEPEDEPELKQDLEGSGKLSSLESAFFYITKVILYKTISSPLRITHLLLQSKKTIIEQNAKTTQSLAKTMKSWIFSTVNSDEDTPSMIKYLSQTNASIFSNNSIYSTTNTLNLLSNIINDPNYGVSYLFFGNLYSIIHGFIRHHSCSVSYDQSSLQQYKDQHVGQPYTDWIEWTCVAIGEWCWSALLCLDEVTESEVKELYHGYRTFLGQSVAHSFVYYQVTNIVDRVFGIRRNRSEFIGTMVSKYIAMGCTNIICYPLDSIRRRQMITNESFRESLNAIMGETHDGYWSLWDGLYVYLLKGLVSQLCIDGCDLLRDWYVKVYKVRRVNESLQRIQGTELICDICVQNKKEYVFNCGHCVCEECKVAMIRQRHKCHICRTNIVSVQKIFI
eukprot:462122_1